MCSKPDASIKPGIEAELVVKDEPEEEVSFEEWVHGQWDPIEDIKPEMAQVRTESTGPAEGLGTELEHSQSAPFDGGVAMDTDEPASSALLADARQRRGSRCPKCHEQFNHVWAMLSHIASAHSAKLRRVEQQYELGGVVHTSFVLDERSWVILLGRGHKCWFCSHQIINRPQALLHMVDSHADKLHELGEESKGAERLSIKVVAAFEAAEAAGSSGSKGSEEMFAVTVKMTLKKGDTS